MRGANLNISRIVVKNIGKVDYFSIIDLPIRLGTGKDCDIKLPGPGNSGFANLDIVDGMPFIISTKDDALILVNEHPLVDKHQIVSGDKINFYGIEINASINEKDLILVIDINNSDYITKPPKFKEDFADGNQSQITATRFNRNKIDTTDYGNSERSQWKIIVLSILSALIIISYLIFSSHSVRLVTNPKDIDLISIKGGWFKFPLGGRFLLREGNYSVEVQKEGYYPVSQSFLVTNELNQTVSVNMRKLPGIINIYTNFAESSQIRINDSIVFGSKVVGKELEPGYHALKISSDRFLPFSDVFFVQGMNVSQDINVNLVPKWGNLIIDSVPSDAFIYNKNIEIGRTPAALELIEGIHDISIVKKGFKAWDGSFNITANKEQTIEPIILVPANAELNIKTIPFGANITVNGRYRGQAPLTLSLSPDEDYSVTFSKSGFGSTQRTIRLKSAEERSITVDLAAVLGRVVISVNQKDAEIFINGKKEGDGNLEIDLPTTSHALLVSKEGFQSFERNIMPRLNYLQNIEVKLLSDEEVRLMGVKKTIINSQQQELRRIEPGKFSLGTSRREIGRRANEVISNIELTEAFYIGAREVTNKEFSKFRSIDSSAADIHASLLADNNPVVLVSWSDAIEYCNWLSNQEGLEPVYTKRFEKWELISPIPNGYRLPTEAEWSWAIRHQARKNSTIYPWGNRFPPRRDFGNYADIAAKNLLPNTINDYDDGYSSTAPVGTFSANLLGIYDGSGNVSEWVSDYYSIPTPGLTEILIDPKGPESGVQHVVRGSSWRHAGITQLRGSYRDFGSEGRIDVGFRVAKNAEK